jgi:hypothetical protein
MIKIIFIILAVLIICLGAILVYENWHDPKIISKVFIPFFIGVVVTIGSIIFQPKPTKEENFYNHFHIFNFTDYVSLDINPIELSMTKSKFYDIYSHIMKSKNIRLSPFGDVEIIYIKILETYSNIFTQSWHLELINDSSFVKNRSYHYNYNDDSKTETINIKSIDFNDTKILQQYFKEIQENSLLHVPPGTSITFSEKEGIVLKNKYYRLNILVSQVREHTRRDKGQRMQKLYDSIDRVEFKHDFENKKIQYTVFRIDASLQIEAIYKGNKINKDIDTWYKSICMLLNEDLNNANEVKTRLNLINN